MSRVHAYEREPYLRELRVEVLSVGQEEGRPFALLDDTILYPEGGGQPADHGRLGGVAVVDVQRRGDEIRHYLERPVEPGLAALELDWARRYDHMQQHTAQHLLSALALHRHGWATRSFHIGAELCDIELDRPPLDDAERLALEEEVARVVGEARPIRGRRVSRDEAERLDARSRGLPEGHVGDVRLVEIEGVDLNTCGGTHLANTAEVGVVKLLGAQPLRGGCRLAWVAGGRARRLLESHEARAAELRRLFDTGDGELAEVAALKLEQLAAERRRSRSLEARLAEAVASGLAAGGAAAVGAHFDDAEPGLLQQVARRLLAARPAVVALLTARGEKGEFFLVAAGEDSGVEAKEAGRRVAELLDGRGGGAGTIFQGRAGSLAGREAALAELTGLVEPPSQRSAASE